MSKARKPNSRRPAAVGAARSTAPAVANVDADDIDGDVVDGDGPASPTTRAGASAGRKRSAATNRWMRWLHVYTSMISLLVVLFFGITGLTLNHPTWSIGGDSHQVYTGPLPAGSAGTSSIDYLTIAEAMRKDHNVIGEVTDHGVSGNEGRITWNAPGYEAALTFDVVTGTYRLVVDEAGLLAVLNDVHKGRNSASSWSWVIDLSALLLVIVAVSGLGIQLFQRKRRTRALIFAAAGLVVTLVMMYIAIS